MRDNVLMVRLTGAERRMIDALAKAEKLPVSTLARRRLLFEAEQRGIIPFSEKHNRAGIGSEATPSAAVA